MSTDELTAAQRAWVTALRSGEYKQTTKVLCRLDGKEEPVGFCCLGVACDLALAADIGLEASPESGYYFGDEYGAILRFGGAGSWLPASVREWLGLRDESGGYYESGIETSLAGLNDSGETFERIADIIESRPKGLFVESVS